MANLLSWGLKFCIFLKCMFHLYRFLSSSWVELRLSWWLSGKTVLMPHHQWCGNGLAPVRRVYFSLQPALQTANLNICLARTSPGRTWVLLVAIFNSCQWGPAALACLVYYMRFSTWHFLQMLRLHTWLCWPNCSEEPFSPSTIPCSVNLSFVFISLLSAANVQWCEGLLNTKAPENIVSSVTGRSC